MENKLKELLRLNKLIKVLIKQEDIEGLDDALKQKEKLIKDIGEVDNEEALLKKIDKLDKENMENLKKLMTKVKEQIDLVKNKKGNVKKSNKKIRKYKSFASSQGYKFDKKK